MPFCATSWLCSCATSLATMFELFAAATRAGLIAADILPGFRAFMFGDDLHDAGGGLPAPNQPDHRRHIRFDVVEETLVARAQIVQSNFATGRLEKAVL